MLCWDHYKVWAFVTYRNISYVRIEARLFSHKVARAIFWVWAKPDLWQFVAGHHFSFLLQPTSLLPLYPQFLVTSFESKPENRSNQQSGIKQDFWFPGTCIPDDFVTRNCHHVHFTLFLVGSYLHLREQVSVVKSAPVRRIPNKWKVISGAASILHTVSLHHLRDPKHPLAHFTLQQPTFHWTNISDNTQ